SVHAEHINVARLVPGVKESSDINGRIWCRGHPQSKGLPAGQAGLPAGTARIEIARSSFGEVVVDTLSLGVRTENRSVVIDSLLARTPFSVVSGAGSVDTSGNVYFDCAGEASDFEALRSALALDSLSGHGTWHAHIEGSADSLAGSVGAEIL